MTFVTEIEVGSPELCAIKPNNDNVMRIEQIYSGCLAQGAYYIESNGEAVVIDPLREVQPYLDRAKRNNAKIKYVFETHFHADFVSGHVDLAAKTGAEIVYGPTSMATGFDCIIGTDGQEFKVGDVSFTLIHTPGHTMESACFLLKDEHDVEKAIFTGDTLFIGDVGRPDLAQHVIADLTEEKLAGHLYDSLHNKIMPLPDHLIVYPAHGAGSACGKNMSDETSDTLGHQKESNYALQPMSKDMFIDKVLTGLMPPPGYFPKNVMMNINGYDSIDTVLQRGLHALSPQDFEYYASQHDVLLLDTRDATSFSKGFIPGAINIGIDGSFAVWAGTLIPDIKQEILIIADPGREEEVVTRLSRVGYDHAVGYLKGGIDAWKAANKPLDSIESIEPEILAEASLTESDFQIMDVRKESEFDSEHVVNAINVPLDFINTITTQIDKQKRYYVHCASGFRSMVFISILKARGYRNLVNVQGGISAIKAAGFFPLTEYVCPTTML